VGEGVAPASGRPGTVNRCTRRIGLFMHRLVGASARVLGAYVARDRLVMQSASSQAREGQDPARTNDRMKSSSNTGVP
jgi:hypothetical protein